MIVDQYGRQLRRDIGFLGRFSVMRPETPATDIVARDWVRCEENTLADTPELCVKIGQDEDRL